MSVRRKCLAYRDEVRKAGYSNQIPLESGKILFSQKGFGFDRLTIRAYFGSQAGKSKRTIQRIARYATGTWSFKNIELAQDIPHKKGYLELLGLATFEKKGSVWFLIWTNEALIPEINSNNHESSESIEEISLSSNSQFSQGEGSEGNRFEKVPLNDETEENSSKDIKNNNNLQGERDKFGIQGKQNIEPELQALANAKPSSSEPDKARVKWNADSNG